ncbi:MAG: hypothetical protein HY470_01830 [Candidatus Ryanbacteria bacterium]|nr:hypothetical protein [Candidatus Ryanbacteria bacterium]
MREERGIIQLLIIIVLSVIILSLLGVSLSSLFNDKTIKENLAFLWQGVAWIWSNYVAGFWEIIKNWAWQSVKNVFS